MRRSHRSARPIRLLLFAGTRPEAIKLAPLALATRRTGGIEAVLVHSGQHDRLFTEALAPFGLVADHALAIDPRDTTPELLTERIRQALSPLLAELRPDMVVVQGDTTSALAGARAAAERGLPVAHLEAGLRSGDPALPWPEEPNRIAIARLAQLHFAPSPGAKRNLRAEAVAGQIHMVGNTGIDALRHVRSPSGRSWRLRSRRASSSPRTAARRSGNRSIG